MFVLLLRGVRTFIFIFLFIVCRFGEIIQISKDDFVKEVTEASAEDPDADEDEAAADKQQQQQQQQQQQGGGGTYVVVNLYSESVSACVLLNAAFAALAKKHKDIKFVKAFVADVLPKFNEVNLPLVLLYFKGECIQQIRGKDPWGDNHIDEKHVERKLRKP